MDVWKKGLWVRLKDSDVFFSITLSDRVCLPPPSLLLPTPSLLPPSSSSSYHRPLLPPPSLLPPSSSSSSSRLEERPMGEAEGQRYILCPSSLSPPSSPSSYLRPPLLPSLPPPSLPFQAREGLDGAPIVSKRTGAPLLDELIICVGSSRKLETRKIFTQITDIFSLLSAEWTSVEKQSFAVMKGKKI
jgi:hypothetical protein